MTMPPEVPPQRQLVCILEEQVELTLEDICRACSAQAEIIVEMIDEGILEASGSVSQGWRFHGDNIRRARIALRLRRDLGINLEGAALVLQLMEENATLRSRLHAMGG